MKRFDRVVLFLFAFIISVFIAVLDVSAEDWKVSTGGVSEDTASNTGSFAFAGSGTGSINITVGSGQSFFNPDTILTPNIDISGNDLVAQVAVVLGVGEGALIFYHDPDSLLIPWSISEIDFYVSSARNFDLFSFKGSVLADVIKGDSALEPFGIFARVFYNGSVLDQASYTSYILSPTIATNPVQAPW